ncbi:413_t:CDS:2 [Cetraspora pellucida]|uniref:413_t:CDS:1 n=1 Tax=Cetraspora pellucida TaxID=1433469 RepID=A0ACA9NHU3_9GLOM|nr:413_t:CDS:2 [Cetraspora pellucida]
MDERRAGETLTEIIDDLLSYDEDRYKHVLETYFTEDAKLSHPLLNVQGTHNIRKVFRVWVSLNSREPDIIDIPAFNGKTAVVQVMQHLSPRVLPFIDIKVPSVTVLKFCKKEDGLFYIEKQEDNWTLEGLIKSVPLISWWYDCVVRFVVGNLVAGAGSFLATANQATSHLAVKANEIRDNGQSAIAQGQNTAKEYFLPITSKAQSYLNSGLSKSQDVVDHAKNAFLNAQVGVKNQISKVTGGHTNGNIPASTEMLTPTAAH